MGTNDTNRLVEEIEPKPSRRSQYLATFSATLVGVGLGAGVSFTSPAGPKLRHPVSPADGSLHLTEFQYDWFSSSVKLAGAFGALVSGFCMDKLGRKVALLLTVAVNVAGWMFIAAGPNFGVLMVGRLLTGMAMGAAPVAVPAYIAEIASTDIRGTLSGCFPLMVTVGNLWAFVFGALIHSWRWLAFVCAIPGFIGFILLLFTKESPLFLLMKGKKQQARDTLQHFRGDKYEVTEEFDTMQQFLDDLKQNQASLKDLLLPYNLKPFMICLMVLFFDQASGISAVLLNLWSIFQKAACGISEDLSSIIVGIVQLATTILSASVVDRAGRKILLIVSASVMAIALVGLGDYFYFKDQNSEWAEETLGWLPLTSIILYIAAINFGFFPVQWILIGELLTPEVKGIAGSVSIMMSHILAFVIALTFDPMQMAIGIAGTYWFYGVMCVFALIFSVIFVPETKGSSMQEIAAYFGNPAANSFDNRETKDLESSEDRNATHFEANGHGGSETIQCRNPRESCFGSPNGNALCIPECKENNAVVIHVCRATIEKY